MKDYNNKLNDKYIEKLDEENYEKNIFDYYSPLFNDNEEDDLICKIKDHNIYNNLSKFQTQYTTNNLFDFGNFENFNINNNNLSLQINDSNNYVQTQEEFFVIPSVNFNNNFNQEKKILGRKKKILVLLFKVKEINFQKII